MRIHEWHGVNRCHSVGTIILMPRELQEGDPLPAGGTALTRPHSAEFQSHPHLGPWSSSAFDSALRPLNQTSFHHKMRVKWHPSIRMKESNLNMAWWCMSVHPGRLRQEDHRLEYDSGNVVI